MKLKRLEIIGFKSFVDKTVVNFDKDVTAVVGPNGCGKSNIVDSIRWVMGEQSAKFLRGKSMEDVIFSGSDTRSPLSMASVELTFSTEGYQTPAQYLNQTEISIGRRLYRTGESEYYINKIPCRLKDITELFLGTGLGKRAYSVIEQGRIAQVVTAKPEERRFYIEEVAGISKFKARKEAALRKMDATNQNLLRLTDITEELERQMRSLDRQAKKATKYKELSDEFQKWDLALQSTQYNGSNLRQLELEKALQELTEKEATIESGLQEEENQIEELRFGVVEQEKELQDLQNDLFEATNFVRLTQEKLNHRRQEEINLSAKVSDLKEKIEIQEDLISDQYQTLDNLTDERALADLEIEEYTSGHEDLDDGIEGKQEEIKLLKEEVEQLRTSISGAQSRLAQIETRKESLTQRDEELRGRIEREETEREQLIKQHDELKKVLDQARVSLQSLKQLKFDLTAKTDEISVELEQLRSNLENEEKTIGELKEELTLRKSRLTSLEELQRNFEGYHEGTRSVLMKKDEISHDGIFGTVADLLETEPEYEGAVSAVLGEKLQYVVVKSQQQGIEAVDYLKAAATGRTSFIPMQVEHKRAAKTVNTQINKGEGVLGSLGQFVSLKADYNNLKDFLFGDIVLVEDLNKALNLWADSATNQTLVTLEGEVVDEDGVITGGSLANTSKALLEKKREMKDLGDLIEKLEQELRDKEFERHHLSNKVKSLESTLESVKSSSMEEAIKIANQEKDLSHFEKEIESLQHKQKNLEKRIADEKLSLEGISPELESLSSEEEELRSRLEEDQSVSEEKRATLEERERYFEEVSRKLTEVKVKLASAQERKSNNLKETSRLLKEISLGEIDLKIFEAQIEVTQARIDLVKKDIEHLTKFLDKKLEKQEEMESVIKVKREAYDQVSHDIRARDNALRSVRSELHQVTTELNQTTLNLSEVRSTMKHLAEQCFERHQKVLNEIYKEFMDEELDIAMAQTEVEELRDKIKNLGMVNTDALEEFEEIKERYEFIAKQKTDLEVSMNALTQAIQKINETTIERFKDTFHLVNERFKKLFPILFNGGNAELRLTDPENYLETGVDIWAQPPGKKPQSISLLSGGEKALTAVSLVFSIFQIKPSPFCVLDEVDAPLDDVNVGRYIDMIREMTEKSQFIVITHNKTTMERSDALYGVTMQEPGVSRIVSVDLSQG